MMRGRFLKLLSETRTSIESLGHSIKSMELREASLQQQMIDVQSKVAEVQCLHRTIDQQYTDTQQIVRDLLQLTEALVTQAQLSRSPSEGPTPPSRDEVQFMMNSIFKGEIRKRAAQSRPTADAMTGGIPWLIMVISCAPKSGLRSF
jgi:hypothetical protein